MGYKEIAKNIGLSLLTIISITLFIQFRLPKTEAQSSNLPRPRFEVILYDGNRDDDPVVYHDKETGQEIVCFSGGGHQVIPSCWLTGRKW